MGRSRNNNTNTTDLEPVTDEEPSWDTTDHGRYAFAMNLPAYFESNPDWIWALTWIKYGFILYKGTPLVPTNGIAKLLTTGDFMPGS